MVKLITYITLEELKKILKAEKRKEYKLAYALAWGSGLRISEVIGGKREGKDIPALTSNRVDLKTHQIRVMEGKGNKDRITVTSPFLNETNIKLLPLKINKRTLQDNFNRITEKVLGKKCNFHMLRHGFGNYMAVEKKIGMTVVQLLMGHTKMETTAIYAKSNPEQAIKSAWEGFT